MALTRQQRRRAVRTLKVNIPFPFNIDPFLDRAIRDAPPGVDVGDFAYSLIIRSKAFRKRFPGIVGERGTLRISPVEYLERERQYKDILSASGVFLNRKQQRAIVGSLVRRNRDPQEFAQWARGIQLAQNNPQVKDFLNQQIGLINQRRAKAAKGGAFPRLKPLRTNLDVVKFFAGRSDKTLYSAYEGALFQSSAAAAGLQVGGGRAAQLARGTQGIAEQEELEQSFADIAGQIRLASVELKAAGLTQRDLETIEFGGPNRALLAERAQQVLNQRKLALQGPAPGVGITLSDEDRPIVRQRTEPATPEF